ncbi:MAG TPA: spore protease YyaC [Bacilli bacterium]
MTTCEEKFQGIVLAVCKTSDELSKALKKYIKANVNDLLFFCIGTDRSTGDSLGPFIGTFLKGLGYINVMGTIDEPIHAMNLDEYISKVPKEKIVIAIDAAMGEYKNIGNIYLKSGSLFPGSALKKDLTPIGDFNISVVLCEDQRFPFLNFKTVSNVRLKNVIKLAKTITESIQNAFPITNINEYKLEELI